MSDVDNRTTESQPAGQPTGDQIDSLLSEYDRAAPPAAPAAPEAPSKTGDDLDRMLDGAIAKNGNNGHAVVETGARSELSRDLELIGLREWAVEADAMFSSISHERQLEVERADFESIVRDAEASVADQLPPDDYVRRYLIAEAQTNAGLAQAWQNRRAGDDGAKAFQQEINKTVRAMTKSLARRPDPQATQEREAVADAVRGASHKAPEGKPLNVSRKSNQEYRAFVEEEFGYTPKV